MLASGVPLFAWDRQGYWEDPNFFPARVRYKPVSSVPYWDERCGMKFKTRDDFRERFPDFWEHVKADNFSPRNYITDNLTLETSARHYASIVEEATS
jgi:hypothetical protein